MKKAERLNQELSYLINHPVFHLSDLTRQFSISRRTALRDITDLEELGLSVYSQPGRAGGYHVINKDPLLPVFFTEDEINAIFFALHALDLISVNPFEQSYRRIYNRLLNTLPANRRKRVVALQDAAHYYNVPPVYDIPHLRDILEACTSLHIIRIETSQIGDKPVFIQFLWVFYRNGLWFFEGADMNTKTWYRARCDRITSFRDTGKEGLCSREELKAGHDRFVREHHTIPFRCRITEEGKEHYYKERYENIHLNGNELTGAYNDDEYEYMLDYLLSYGSHVKVLEPPRLREGYRNRLKKMMQEYR